MASTISAGTTAGTALNIQSDTTGNLAFKTGSANVTAMTLDNNQNVSFANAVTYSGNIQGAVITATTNFAGSGSALTTLNASNISSGTLSTSVLPASGVNASTITTGTLGVANGGTGLTSTPSNGQLDIGNGTGFTRATLTAGSGISITNGAGSISIAATGGGTVTSVATGNGLSGGTITSTGTLTIACPSTGSVGAYSFLRIASGGSGVTAGSTASASILRYCQVSSDAGAILNDVGTPSGTWRNMMNGTWEYTWATVACRVS